MLGLIHFKQRSSVWVAMLLGELLKIKSTHLQKPKLEGATLNNTLSKSPNLEMPKLVEGALNSTRLIPTQPNAQ